MPAPLSSRKVEIIPLTTSLTVPGYEVDSLIKSTSFRKNGATDVTAPFRNAKSGSRLSFKGVGTQITTTSVPLTSVKSWLAL